MRLLVQHDFGTLKTVQSVNTDQAAPTFFDDGKRVFGSPFPCNVAASRAECSGDALVHMEQQNVAERSVLNVRHHKLGTAGSLCFLLGDCRETASQMVQHIQPPDGAGDKQKRQQHVSLTFSDDEDEGKELSVPDPEPLPEERVIFNEKQEAIRNAMNALPVDFREILELRVVRQLPYEQIAQIMDLPVGTVKSRLARARLQLKKRLDAGNFFETGASKCTE